MTKQQRNPPAPTDSSLCATLCPLDLPPIELVAVRVR